VLAKLEELQLVQRTPDPQDRRSSLVAATPAGSALLEELRTRKTAFLAKRLEGLDPEERATLDRAADILERMLAE
jgi:DNA-binding MarR family transcriptional regulator